MNPADSLTKTTNNFYQSTNKRGSARLAADLERITSLRLVDVYIKEFDSDFDNRYVVDVYEKGFGLAPTRIDMDAVAVDPREVYDLWYPGKGVLSGDKILLVGGMHIFGFRAAEGPDEDNIVVGWPTAFDGIAHTTIAKDEQTIKINFAYPLTWNVGDVDYAEDDKFIWVRYPKPYESGGISSAGVILLGAGGSSSIPAPTAKYQVYTPVDDSLEPIWTAPRFM